MNLIRIINKFNLLSTVIKEFIDGLLQSDAPGPAISFSVFDLVKAIELISKRGPIGRGKLSEEIGLGAGAVRTLIKRLMNSDLITTSGHGCALTDKGKDLWEKISLIMPKKVILEKNELVSSRVNVAVIVKEGVERVINGIFQRDAAVRAGAEGATTIIYKDGKMAIPMVSSDLSDNFPELHRQLIQALKPKDGDIIIIGSGKDRKSAEYGALAAVWTII